MDTFQNFQQPQQRPTIITVFGILTFIGAGLGILGGLFGLLFSGVSQFNPIPQPLWIPLVTILFNAIKIVGVVQMFKMKRLGFFLYTIPELGLLFVSVLNIFQMKNNMSEILDSPYMDEMQIEMMEGMMGPWLMFTVIFSILLGALWIGVYGSQLKKMN